MVDIVPYLRAITPNTIAVMIPNNIMLFFFYNFKINSFKSKYHFTVRILLPVSNFIAQIFNLLYFCYNLMFSPISFHFFLQHFSVSIRFKGEISQNIFTVVPPFIFRLHNRLPCHLPRAFSNPRSVRVVHRGSIHFVRFTVQLNYFSFWGSFSFCCTIFFNFSIKKFMF